MCAVYRVHTTSDTYGLVTSVAVKFQESSRVLLTTIQWKVTQQFLNDGVPHATSVEHLVS